MLILILIDVQYSHNAVFSFEKGSNRQNHSYLCSHHPVKEFSPTVKLPIPHHWGGGGFTPNPTPCCYLENPDVRRNQFCLRTLSIVDYSLTQKTYLMFMNI